MKKIITRGSRWIGLALITIVACTPEVERINELPENIIPSKPCQTLYRSIMDMFPEYKNNRTNNEGFFADTVQKKVVLTKDSEVYVTFISEGAGYSNTFGYYTYNANDVPQSGDDFKWEIIFPNVSDRILKQGDMVKIGTGEFSAGTVIGFFLIFQGWDHGTINYDKPAVFTDYHLNQSGQQQHIFFKQKDCGDIVLAFEDNPVIETGDFDLNDMIFTIHDNRDELETTSFDLQDVVVR
ncbi:MAG TPA: DUF4114 domain-containing protein [Ohtaekwangia sp.]|nr:DUF4114 domain-containing protein [Ohtaekwangia sp.]